MTEPVVKFYGYGGLTVAWALNSRLSCVESFRPDIIIVELGTNDLTRFGPAEVGSNLEFARNHHANYGVKLVCVNHILFRAQSPLFNAKVRVLNRYLNAVLEQLPFAIFWCHRGFWNCANNFYLDDGVNLNALGNYKLYRSLWGGTLGVLSLFRHLQPIP